MKTPSLNISVVQENAVLGDIKGNVMTAIRYLEREDNADLVVFPECFVTGYPLADLVLRPGFLAGVEQGIAKLREAVILANGPAVLIGAPMAGATLPYNAAYLIEPSGATRVVRKHELPNNDVFDERRTFAMSDEPPAPLSFRGYNLGVMICEDMWHGRVARGLTDELADVLLVLNGSPYTGGKQAVRRKIARTRIRDTGLPLIYANLVGGQDELVFDGGSFIMNIEGGFSEAEAFAPGVMRLSLERDAAGDTLIHLTDDRALSPYPADRLESDYNACVLGLRDYVRKSGMDRVVIGVSGGLDSALVLTMAADALGEENVTGVMMPTEYTSDESLTLADALMDRLGVVKDVLPIGEMFAASREALDQVITRVAAARGRTPTLDVTHENIQARLRGLSLMALTNGDGGIVLSTGNKSEMSVGYATLYGDMNGGFNPLKSVYKSHAFRMAEWRNTITRLAAVGDVTEDPIPKRIITRPPSAELSEDQTDQASLGDYELLDEVLMTLVEGRAGAVEAARHVNRKFGIKKVTTMSGGVSASVYADRIAGLVRRAQYKRDQACPGVKLNATDFGTDWRLPIAGSYSL